MSRVGILAIAASLLGVGAGSTWAWFSHHDQGDQFTQLMASLVQGPSPQVSGDIARVVIENGEEFDFGVMGRDESREHTFLVRNNTDQPLTLSIVETTCKCTVGDRPDKAVPPGGLGKITLRWTAKSFEDEFRQSATLETSDPVRKLIGLSVYGKILQLVSVDPPSIAFSNVSYGSEREHTLVLRSYEDPHFEIRSADWLDDEMAQYFDVTWRAAPPEVLASATPAKAAIACTVRLKPGMPRGRFDLRLTLHTTVAKVRHIEIPVAGNIVSDVMVIGPGYKDSNETLDLGVVDSKDGLTRQLRIMAKGEHRDTFQVTQVITEPAEQLQVRVGEPSALNQGAVRYYPLEVTIPRGTKAGRFLGGDGHPVGKIVLKTNHPDTGDIVITTRFAVVAR